MFSTTSLRPQDIPASGQGKAPEDIEKFVREARQRFRDTLPKGYLTDEEYRLYERLYGPPLRETEPEDVGIPFRSGAVQPDIYVESSEDALAREMGERLEEEAILEEEAYLDRAYQAEGVEAEEMVESAESTDVIPDQEPIQEKDTRELEAQDDLEPELPITESIASDPEGYINTVARNQREYDALVRLQRDFETNSLKAAEKEAAAAARATHAEEEDDMDDEAEDSWEDDMEYPDDGETPTRFHPLTAEGKFRTSPTSIMFSKEDFIQPIQTLLGRTAMSHVREAAEKAFGGPGLPYSPITPMAKRNIPMKPIALEAGSYKMSEIEADAYITAFLPPAYASITGILVEVRKRLGTEWMRKLMARGDGQGPRVLDAGAGGAGLLAWQDILNAEWEAMRDDGLVNSLEPQCKKTVVVGSDTVRRRISSFLHNTTFIPRLPDYVHMENQEEQLDGPRVPQARKTYDVIIASHLLLSIKEGHRRKAVLNQLWSLLSPEGGVLVYLEKGTPRGFEAVAEVRQQLLDEYLVPVGTPDPSLSEEFQPAYERVREPGWIIAPCTTHRKCPMYLTPGTSTGRKDFCHFSQRFVRPQFLQQILGASSRNHDDVQFSYIAMQRGVSSPKKLLHGEEATTEAFKGYENADPDSPPSFNQLSLPRAILPPLKRHGHVILDLCTPAGRIERWTVPRSFSRQAYRDARKAKWGDVWALGAKTRVPSNIRLGRPEAEDDGGVRAQRAKMGKKAKVIKLGMNESGVVSAEQKGPHVRERRTKGRKLLKTKTLLKELMEGDD